MNILYIVLAFIGALIVLYIALAVFFFGRNYRVKMDKIFSNAVKSILENTEKNTQDSNCGLDKSKISIRELSEKNSNFQYLNIGNNKGTRNE